MRDEQTSCMKLALLAVLLVGCVGPEPPPPPQEPITPRLYEEEQQGRYLLGNKPDGLSVAGQPHFSVGTQAINRTDEYVSVSNGQLVVKNLAGKVKYSSTSGSFVHLQLKSATGQKVEIESVVTETFGLAYRLMYSDGVNGWTPYCDPDDVAVPMQGVWTASGYHQSSSDLSFACHDGTAFKCFDWGYIPGGPFGDDWNAHQACTRMARADICGDGQSHTRELTPIVIREYAGRHHPKPMDPTPLRFPKKLPAPPDLDFYESSWVAEENKGAVCLSKQRWASLPVHGYCEGILDDPRVVPGAMFCEDYYAVSGGGGSDDGSAGDATLMGLGAILANASRTQDMYLHRWMNPTTRDVVATVRGYYSEFKTSRVAPFTNYTRHLGDDGILLRNLPGSITDGSIVDGVPTEDMVTEVFTVGTTDLMVMPVPGLPRTDPSFEGYLLNDGTSSDGDLRVPFNRYVNNVTGDQLTSSGVENVDYEIVDPAIGYVYLPTEY